MNFVPSFFIPRNRGCAAAATALCLNPLLATGATDMYDYIYSADKAEVSGLEPLSPEP
jgi:hypothetical protein